MKHTLSIVPAYDLRVKGYGVHACELWFSVSHIRGAVSLTFYTQWDVPELQKVRNYHTYPWQLQPSGAVLCGHWAYKHSGSKKRKCEFTRTGVCWDAGISFTRAHEFEVPLLTGGSAAVFKALEAVYHDWLKEE